MENSLQNEVIELENSLNELLNLLEISVISKIKLEEEGIYKNVLKLKKNINNIKLSYELLILFYKKGKIKFSDHSGILQKNYLAYVDDDNIYINEKNIVIINKNIEKFIIKELKKILENFSIENHKIFIKDLELKSSILEKSIWDGFFPINSKNRFPSKDHSDSIIKVELLKDSKMKKINKKLKNNVHKIFILSYKYKKEKIKLKKVVFHMIFNKKNFVNKKFEAYNNIKLNDVIHLFENLEEKKLITKTNKIMNRIKNEIVFFFPINDNFYKIGDINFNNFNLEYLENEMNDEREKLDNNIKNHIENLNSKKLNQKPDNDNYFECKVITKIKLDNLKNKNFKKNIIVHVSGGGFLVNGYNFYKYHLKKIIKLKDNILYSIIYRLGPNNPFPNALNDIINVYFYIWEKYKDEEFNIILYGDSAGGHLIISLLNFLVIFKKKLPDKVIVFYPVLETSTIYFNEGIFVSYNDPMLHINLLNQIKENIFNNENLNSEKNILSNPSFFYDFITKKYPQIIIFYSTKDPFSFNIKNFYNVLIDNNVNAKAYEIKNLYHGFLAFLQKTNIKFREINKVLSLFLDELKNL